MLLDLVSGTRFEVVKSFPSTPLSCGHVWAIESQLLTVRNCLLLIQGAVNYLPFQKIMYLLVTKDMLPIIILWSNTIA